MYLPLEEAKSITKDVLQAAGCPERDADIAADVLIDANLHGVNTHGISRLAIYTKRLLEGRINPNPQIQVEQKGGVLLVDGDNGLGQVVTYKAMEEAIARVKEQGIVSVGIKNSNHFGHAFYYCNHVAAHDAFCMMTTNSPKGIPPWGGKEAYFGTNPIGFGFPASRLPVVVDMSSSLVARGNIILAAKNNESIPEDWAIDSDGKATTDPNEALKGSVLPFGGAKGYALALSLEVMAGVLSGAAFGPHVNNIYADDADKANVGHFMIVSDIAHYMNKESYYERIDQMIEEVKNVATADGYDEISIPGERKKVKAEQTESQGVYVSPEVQQELNELTTELLGEARV
ncbi:malate dehydrogenase (NAD) [Salsuginibacillus halophilus]|uniref:Malate dehydrogenase (NAD) n=1 Tax=Salsuginibacillus halophilus TaxID=517424 RepID=A0A2P8HL15_9BACI|nr:Ldh family oxidoreductase [Salsuginibacillus halophilus]PSL46904.1 malate dehydrogenase (NAD) [Salsuginibacillus halophilus]